MIVIIDNYDSFTYNLFQYFSELGETVEVFRNDVVTVEVIKELQPSAIVISPGPGTPSSAGRSKEIIESFYMDIPILGVCLGHQAIAEVFGATVQQAKNIMHGKQSYISSSEDSILSDCIQPICVMRYHSLIVREDTVVAPLSVLAKSTDDYEIMLMKHQQYPVYGMQFHPESIGTESGKQLIYNFIKIARKEHQHAIIS